MAEHCDGVIPNSLAPELFFNRSWLSFDQILNFHRTGSLHFDAEICALVYKTELEYWGVDELLMDPCCALKYYPDIELCVSELNGEEKAKQRRAIKEQDEDFGESRLGRLRKTLWNLTENPETSKAALILGYCSLGLVIVSTITFVLSTFPGQYIGRTYIWKNLDTEYKDQTLKSLTKRSILLIEISCKAAEKHLSHNIYCHG